MTDGLDALLAKHGYERGDHLYRAVRPNTENLLLFCHFGVECVLLSRLFDCSPVTLWHHTVALPSSVTVVTTEEREKGTAIFRMSRFADLSHLDAAGEARPSSPASANSTATEHGKTERHSENRISTLIKTKALRTAQGLLQVQLFSDHAKIAVGDGGLGAVGVEEVQEEVGHFRADLPQDRAAGVAVVPAGPAGAVAAEAGGKHVVVRDGSAAHAELRDALADRPEQSKT